MNKGNTIKISFTDETKLQAIVEKLGDLVERVKIPKDQKGQHRTAYIILRK